MSIINYLSKGWIAVLAIAICALSVVNSSSGSSHFSAQRGVKMRVVDSKDAFISLPNKIEMDVVIEEDIDTIDATHQLTIKNNMGQCLELNGIEFSNPALNIDNGKVTFSPGDKKDIPIRYNAKVSKVLANRLKQDMWDDLSSATLYFVWSEGNTTIYTDVVINYKYQVEVSGEGTEEDTNRIKEEDEGE